MTRFTLTDRAERSLEALFLWTVSHFGPRQATRYCDALIERCAHLTSGRPPRGRSCAGLLPGHPDAKGLMVYREGRHFIVYEEDSDGLTVIDFVHASRDLPGLIDGLENS